MQSKRARVERARAPPRWTPTAVDLDVLAADQRGDAACARPRRRRRRARCAPLAARAATPSPPSASAERPRRRRRAARKPAAPAAQQRRGGAPRRRATSTGRWRVRGSCLRLVERLGARSSAPRPSTITSGRCSCASASARRRAHGATRPLKPRSRARREQRASRGRRRRRRSARRGRPAATCSRSSAAAASSASSSAGGAAAGGASAPARPRTAPARRRRRLAGAGGSTYAGSSSVNALPSPGVLRDADLAAEQARDLAADRQAEAGAAVAAARRPVGLLEGLEDQPQLVLRDADAGVA